MAEESAKGSWWTPFILVSSLYAVMIAGATYFGLEDKHPGIVEDWMKRHIDLGSFLNSIPSVGNVYENTEEVSFYQAFLKFHIADTHLPDSMRDQILHAGGIIKDVTAYTVTQDPSGLVHFGKAPPGTDTSHYYRWGASTEVPPPPAPVATEAPPAPAPVAPPVPVPKVERVSVIPDAEIHDPHEGEWHLSQIAHKTSGAPTDTELASLQAFLKNHDVSVSDDVAREYYAKGSYTAHGVQHSLWRSAFRDTEVVDKDGVKLAAFFSTPKA